VQDVRKRSNPSDGVRPTDTPEFFISPPTLPALALVEVAQRKRQINSALFWGSPTMSCSRTHPTRYAASGMSSKPPPMLLHGCRGEGPSAKLRNTFFLAFLRFSRLFSAFLSLFTYFSTSISYVPNFYKLIRQLQWGIRSCLAGGKISWR
jgi:hypothetical protein